MFKFKESLECVIGNFNNKLIMHRLLNDLVRKHEKSTTQKWYDYEMESKIIM